MLSKRLQQLLIMRSVINLTAVSPLPRLNDRSSSKDASLGSSDNLFILANVEPSLWATMLSMNHGEMC